MLKLIKAKTPVKCVSVCVKLLHRYSKCFEQLVCVEGRRVHSNLNRRCVRKEDVPTVL